MLGAGFSDKMRNEPCWGLEEEEEGGEEGLHLRIETREEEEEEEGLDFANRNTQACAN